jgi:hypothetical protein
MRIRLVLWLVVVVALLQGCAQDVGLIDRVQPGALNKHLFEGEWYYRRTVVDAPYTAGFTFIGESDDMERIRWQINEDRLVAYRAYDFIAGTDLDHSTRKSPDATGKPVAIFRILKQFDINRGYSTATGEQDNILRENDADRAWYDRGYLRVDWAENLAPGYGFEFTVDTIRTEPVKWSLNDPKDPDAFTMAWRKADTATGWRESRDPKEHRQATQADYFDVVSKLLATPETYNGWDDAGPWSAPVCWFYGNEDCKPAEITIRSSFLKVDAKGDYEPLDYPDNYLARDDKGDLIRTIEYTDGTVQRDPNGDPVPVPMFDKFGFFRAERYGYDEKHGEVESARKLMIARWNLWQKSHGADGKPLAYAQRLPKPIVYYKSIGFPAELDAGAKTAAAEWDDAFRTTVAALQNRKPDELPTLFVLKDNTFATDKSGKVIDRGQRVGDLRYSMLDYVAKPTRAGLLGYGPSAVDPVTGEIVSAAAHVYGAAHKTLATRARDILRLVRGEIQPEEFGLGHVTEGEVRHALQAFAATGSQPTDGKGKTAAMEDAHGEAGSPAHMAAIESAKAFAQRTTDRKKQKEIHQLKKKAMAGHEGWAQARMALLDKSPMADALLNRDVALAFGSPALRDALASSPPGAPLPPLSVDEKQSLSPSHWAPMSARMRHLERQRLLGRHSITLAEFSDDSVTGLAQELKDKTDAEAWAILYAAVFRSTAEHELGHTLGLRHNFEGSTDALNYNDQYWALRGDKGQPMDLPTPGQSAANMDGYKYASIMDYAQTFHSDLKGLGHYDRAAIAFGYGQLVEVFEQPPVDPLLLEQVSLATALRGLRHYTSIPKMLGGVDRVKARKLVPYADLVRELTGEGSTATAGKKKTLWEVPYRFCSDEYTQGTPTCNAFDSGADSLEIIRNNLQEYKDHYLLQAFRGDRVEFRIDDYQARIWGRYLLPVALQYQNWVFWQYDPDDPLNPGMLWDNLRADPADAKKYGLEDTPWEQAAQGGLTMTAAVRYGISAMADVIAQPEPGLYCLDTTTQSYYKYATSITDSDGKAVPQCATPVTCTPAENAPDCADIVIPLGTGRLYETDYDTSTGYYFFERLRHIGSFYDKLTAMDVLTDPSTYFIGVDSSQPVHNYLLSMTLYFGKEMNHLFGGLAAGRQDSIGFVQTKTGALQGRAWFDPAVATTQAGQVPVEVPGLFILRNYAISYGLSWLSANWDQSFNDGLKIWVEGSGQAFSPPAEATVTTFVNPANYRVYHAVKMPDPQWFSPGFTMVSDAAKLAADLAAGKPDVYNWQLEEAVQIIEIARGMYDVFGQATF